MTLDELVDGMVLCEDLEDGQRCRHSAARLRDQQQLARAHHEFRGASWNVSIKVRARNAASHADELAAASELMIAVERNARASTTRTCTGSRRVSRALGTKPATGGICGGRFVAPARQAVRARRRPVVSGMGINYRRVRTASGRVHDVGILTAGWTLPRHRKRGCYSRMLEEAVEIGTALGYEALVSFSVAASRARSPCGTSAWSKRRRGICRWRRRTLCGRRSRRPRSSRHSRRAHRRVKPSPFTTTIPTNGAHSTSIDRIERRRSRWRPASPCSSTLRQRIACSFSTPELKAPRRRSSPWLLARKRRAATSSHSRQIERSPNVPLCTGFAKSRGGF